MQSAQVGANIKELKEHNMPNPSKILAEVWEKVDNTLEIKMPPFSNDMPVTKETIVLFRCCRKKKSPFLLYYSKQSIFLANYSLKFFFDNYAELCLVYFLFFFLEYYGVSEIEIIFF